MATKPEQKIYYMSISARTAFSSKSFEEIRIDDYFKAYQTTGRPPVPCPDQPVDANARAQAGLPPLFEPLITSGDFLPPPTSSNPIDSTESPFPTDPSQLPESQAFAPTKLENEIMHSISSTSPYKNFSFEELRFYAYAMGHQVSPTPLESDAATLNEVLVSITAKDQFKLHSFEELRLSFVRQKRELTSVEILTATPTPAVTTGFAPTIGATPLGNPIAGGAFFRSPIARPF